MSVYDLHFNKDSQFFRNVLIGALHTLYDNITWYNQIGTDINEVQQIKVPFSVMLGNQDRYLNDNFLNNIIFDPHLLEAETFYNTVPRGIVELSSISIDSSAITNKYVRMFHQRQDSDGTLNTYNSETFLVPLTLSLSCTVLVDSLRDVLECTTAIISTFYKIKTFNVDVNYSIVPCTLGFSESYDSERQIEYSFTDKKEMKVPFELELKTVMYIHRPETTLFAGNTMQTLQSGIYLPPITPGSTSVNSNTGITGWTGAFGEAFYGDFAELPTWPDDPSTPMPPQE